MEDILGGEPGGCPHEHAHIYIVQMHEYVPQVARMGGAPMVASMNDIYMNADVDAV